MMLLWLRESPIQYVRGPVTVSANPRLARYAELKIRAAGLPMKCAMRSSTRTCCWNVPSMNRTAPGPTPNSCTAASAARSSAG